MGMDSKLTQTTKSIGKKSHMQILIESTLAQSKYMRDMNKEY